MIKLIRDASYIFPSQMIWMIGNFDGVHLGHQALIETARDLKEKHNMPIALLTFEPHPRRFFKPDMEIFRLVSWRDKLKLLEKFGVDYCYAYRFNKEFSKITAESFASDFLPNSLHAKHLIIGDDFQFGAGRLGTNQMLLEYGKEFGYETHILHEKQSADMLRCSSSNVRKFLAEGDVAGAEKILGRNFSVSAHVQKGHQLARKLGFPTANIAPPHVLYPKNGVYSGEVHIEGQIFKAVANIGVKPTIFDNPPLLKPLIEVHILDKNLDIYGKRIEFFFQKRIRDEMKFPSLEALQEQIKMDIQRVKTDG